MKSDLWNVIPTRHIAAAAVAIHHLGPTFDIHISSIAFLFPHLANMKEVGETMKGKPMANVWMLCERVWAGKDEKPVSELDEMTPVRDLVSSGFSHEEIRFWLLYTHYRKPVQISRKAIQNAIRGYRRLVEFISKVLHARCVGSESKAIPEMIFSLEQGFFDALADDLNIPKAMAALYRFVRQMHPILDTAQFDETQRSQILDSVEKLNRILGVFDLDLKGLSPEEQTLVARREAARAAKNWEEADRLREDLLNRGVRVLDTPCGTRWERTK